MKLLVDMNLSPDWVAVLRAAGWEAEHWAQVGNPRATDTEIMAWAEERGWVVFTHDLDFGSLLALNEMVHCACSGLSLASRDVGNPLQAARTRLTYHLVSGRCS